MMLRNREPPQEHPPERPTPDASLGIGRSLKASCRRRASALFRFAGRGFPPFSVAGGLVGLNECDLVITNQERVGDRIAGTHVVVEGTPAIAI